MVRAKFYCVSNEGEDTSTIILRPVVSGSEENALFYKYTPGGQVELSIVNPDAAKQFEVGKEYYVDFAPAQE